jgi:hypothetical protein
MSRRGLGAVATFALLLGASGCHTFKYFDLTLSFDQASLDSSEVRTISRCRILVSGAESNNFILDKCPNHGAADPHNGYVFEYSSFAESGTLNFAFEGFVGLRDTDACKLAQGNVAVAVTGLMTIPSALTASKNPQYDPTCGNVSPVTDGGP